MESLLSVAFENISSKNPDKIHRGLRQIEGLLAQICLSRPPTTPSRRRTSIQNDTYSTAVTVKSLDDLTDDPAFYDYFELQQSFEYNAAQQTLDTLDRLLGQPPSPQNDILLTSTLSLLHGLLLLHPPSRSLFARTATMTTLLDLLDPVAPSPILSAALLVLVTALLGRPRNARVFEAAEGPRTVASLFKTRCTPHEVKMRALEFLYFYLMPEGTGVARRESTYSNLSGDTLAVDPVAAMTEQRHASRASTTSSGGNSSGRGDTLTRTTDEKQALLGRYLHNVEGLVQDLRESGTFDTGEVDGVMVG